MQKSKTKESPQYTVSISPILYHKMDQHIYALKKLLNSRQTKNDWIAEAVAQKLARDSAKDDRYKDKPICIKIDPLTREKLEKRVQNIRSLRYSYSKKQWVLDAIHEKLGNEEEKVKSKLKEYREALNKK
jgi:hypothetical protein